MIRHIIAVLLFVLCYYFFDASTMLAVFMGYCALSLVQIARSGGSLVTPMSLLYVISMVIAYSNMDLIKISTTSQNITYYYIQKKYISDAALIYCIGSVCFMVGMDLAKKISLPAIAIAITPAQTKLFFFFVLIFCNRYALILLWSLGSISKLFYLSSLLGIMFFVIVWIRENDRTSRNRAIILYVTTTILSVFLAYLRSEIIMPSIIFVLGLIIAYNDVRVFASYRMIPFVLIFLLFSSLFSKIGRDRETKSNAQIIAETLSGDSKEDDYESSATPVTEDKEKKGTLFQRVANLAQLTQVVRLTEKNGFYEGRASAPLALALIPRFLWPDKPTIELGTWFALEAGIAYKADKFSRANNSVNMTIMGELFLDFGWLGVVLGCVLIGVFFAALWNATAFYDLSYNLTGTIFGGFLMQYAIVDIGPDLEILVTFLSIYMLFYVIRKIV